MNHKSNQEKNNKAQRILTERRRGYKFFLSWLFTYSFFVGCLSFFLQTPNVPWLSLISQKDFYGLGYLILRMPSHHVFLALFFAFPILLLSVFLFIKKRKIFIFFSIFLLISVQTLFLLYSTLDTLTFIIYQMRLDHMTFSMLFSGVWKTVMSHMIESGDIKWMVLIILFLSFTSLFIAKWTWSLKYKFGLKSFCFFLSVYLTAQIIHGFSDAYGYSHITIKDHYLQAPVFELTFKKTLRRFGVNVKRNELSISTEPLQTIKYPKRFLHCEKPLLHNVFILVIDSLRFDMLNSETMPNLMSFANESTHFQHHYSSSNNSRMSLFGLFYGLSPNYFWIMRENRMKSVLVDKFLSENYYIDVFSYDPLENTDLNYMALQEVKENHRGNVFKFQISSPMWSRDQEIMKLFIKKLQKTSKKEPYFAYMFLGSLHNFSAPSIETSKFQPVAKSFTRLKSLYYSKADIKPILNLYKSSVYFVDQLVGEALKVLKDGDWLKNSIVIITGDHGQEVNKLGLGVWEHFTNFSDWQVRVPMVVHWPKKSPRKITSVTSHTDIVPTLLKESFRCANDINDYSTGRNLFEPESNTERRLLVLGWHRNRKALITGKKVYTFSLTGVKVLDPITYKEKKGELIDLESVFNSIIELKKQFL